MIAKRDVTLQDVEVASPSAAMPSKSSWRKEAISTLDADGSVLEYNFRAALFRRAFEAFFSGGVISWTLGAYLIVIIFFTVLAATAACPQQLNAPLRSHLLGVGACWRNTYAVSWGDMTLLPLTSFLLGLLVHNVHSRWWTCRTMVQEVLNHAVHVFFLLHVAMTPDPVVGDKRERDAIVLRVERRLNLALRLVVFSAQTDMNASKTLTGIYLEKLVKGLPPAPELGHIHGRPALLTAAEMVELGHQGAGIGDTVFHRRTYLVLGWLARDLCTLCNNGHVDSARLSDLMTAVGKLRVLGEDLPMFCRVQLPFASVSLVACVVHLSIFQICCTSASYIGAGLAEPELWTKALVGLFSLCVLPTVFLSILKLQALMSNPFGKFSGKRTNFPVDQFKRDLAQQLHSIKEHMGEGTLERVQAIA